MKSLQEPLLEREGWALYEGGYGYQEHSKCVVKGEANIITSLVVNKD